MALLQCCVVGIDGSEGSAAAFRWAVAQAGATGPEAQLVAVHAFSPGAELWAAAAQVNLDPVRAEHDRLLQHEWIAAARGSGVEVSTQIVDDLPAAALLRSSATAGGAPIVIGRQSQGRWTKHHIGHVAGQLLHHADSPVIMIDQATALEPIAGPVVVAVHEPTDVSHRPIAWAATLAEERELVLHVVSVAAPPPAGLGYSAPGPALEADLAAVQRANREATDQLALALSESHPAVTVTVSALVGHPADALAKAITEVGAGVAVVGSHHPGALVSFVSDGVARRLPTLVTCPVVAVPA